MNRMYLMSHRRLNFTEGSIRAMGGGEENGDRLFVTQPTVESRSVENRISQINQSINQFIYSNIFIGMHKCSGHVVSRTATNWH